MRYGLNGDSIEPKSQQKVTSPGINCRSYGLNGNVKEPRSQKKLTSMPLNGLVLGFRSSLCRVCLWGSAWPRPGLSVAHDHIRKGLSATGRLRIILLDQLPKGNAGRFRAITHSLFQAKIKAPNASSAVVRT